MRLRGIVPKVYFYTLCFIFAFCIILLITSRHNFNNTWNHQQSERSTMPRKNREQVYDRIGNALKIIRKRIENELSIYKFSYTGEGNVSSLIPEAGGQPFRSVIVTTWRSGSNFLGEIINSMPGNFYNYEPLLSIKGTVRGPPLSYRAVEWLRKMLNCDFTNMPEYFENGKIDYFQFRENKRLIEHCRLQDGQDNLCFDDEFISRSCKLFPFQSMKLVRFRLNLTEELLLDTGLNIKVIFLVRDPRGVMQSRQHCDWCQLFPDCWEPERLCSDMVNDYYAAVKLMDRFPNRLLVIRYEELALNPPQVIDKIFQFFGMSVPSSVTEFLESHTKQQGAGIFSTYRVSEKVPFRWIDLLDYEHIDKIQNACSDAMDLWGYEMAYNETHLKSVNFNPQKMKKNKI